jgi:hypothetical protein
MLLALIVRLEIDLYLLGAGENILFVLVSPILVFDLATNIVIMPRECPLALGYSFVVVFRLNYFLGILNYPGLRH